MRIVSTSNNQECQKPKSIGNHHHLREERAHSPTEQNDIISRVNWSRECGFVFVHATNDVLKERRRGAID